MELKQQVAKAKYLLVSGFTVVKFTTVLLAVSKCEDGRVVCGAKDGLFVLFSAGV